MKKIAVLTSGGDSPGMNAAIRSVVRSALAAGMEVYGVERGYHGLINGNLEKMDRRSVSDMVHRGGTILKTARSQEFTTVEGRKKAADVLSAYGIDSLVVIGGDGSFRGMQALYDDCGIDCVGIPGTIDNDLSYTDFTIGFDSAVNTVLGAVSSVRDTMNSHDRACVIEVMGRRCGDIAIYAGLAGGAEFVLVPEIPFDMDVVVRELKRNRIKGKTSNIVILAEGAGDCYQFKRECEARDPSLVMHTVKLGYIQRGGAPTMADRVLAARCGAKAIEVLQEGNHGALVVGVKGGEMISMPVKEALEVPRNFDKELYKISETLGK